MPLKTKCYHHVTMKNTELSNHISNAGIMIGGADKLGSYSWYTCLNCLVQLKKYDKVFE